MSVPYFPPTTWMKTHVEMFCLTGPERDTNSISWDQLFIHTSWGPHAEARLSPWHSFSLSRQIPPQLSLLEESVLCLCFTASSTVGEGRQKSKPLWHPLWQFASKYAVWLKRKVNISPHSKASSSSGCWLFFCSSWSYGHPINSDLIFRVMLTYYCTL